MSLPSSFSPPFPFLMLILRSRCVLEGMHPQASSRRLDVVILMVPCDAEHTGSFIPCVRCRDKTFFQPGCWSRATGRADPADGKDGGPGRTYVVMYNREDTGRREVEISFCVFACLFVVFFTPCILILLQQP